MGLIDSVSDIVEEVGPDRDGPDEPTSEGSYWCTDCGTRIRDIDAEGNTPPTCPECGEPMTFERQPPDDCAC